MYVKAKTNIVSLFSFIFVQFSLITFIKFYRRSDYYVQLDSTSSYFQQTEGASFPKENLPPKVVVQVEK